MAKARIPQSYPRITDAKRADYGCLDDATLVPHHVKIEPEQLKKLIRTAIRNAESKSSREAMALPEKATPDELKAFYRQEGKKLFDYFKKYIGDPAATAHQMHGKHYRDVGLELFRNRALQKGRMNSGWRYQFLSVALARASKRFESVSDIGASEGDFNAVIKFQDKANYQEPLSLYVSVKNRSNTMGGQDWPKAIVALEDTARNDKNLTGPYCCIFGIAMDRGQRYIKKSRKTKAAVSDNTEVWLSDFFWPFFANHSYEEIMTAVLDVLIAAQVETEELATLVEVPDEVLDAFGECCLKAALLDDLGNFNDPYKLVQFFCHTPKKTAAKAKEKIS